MMKAHWARAALFAVALPACAHGAQQHASATLVAPTASGQAAQPGSWLPTQTASAQSPQRVTDGESRGQAAQQYSWIDSDAPSAPPALRLLADDGPSYLGGRAAQPYSWATTGKSADTSRQIAFD